MLTDSNGSASFKTDLSGLKAVWLADANSDGTQEIFISGNYITDDYSTYCLCYTADGALEPLQFTGDDRGDASEVNTVFNGYIEDISDSEGIILAGVCNVLGTYKGTRHYEFIDSCLRPAPGSVWSLADNEVWLTLKSDLPVTYDNGGSGYLTAGGSVLFTSTDISSWIRFTDSTGTTGLIALDKQNDGGGYKISGIGESSYFDSIPYAG